MGLEADLTPAAPIWRAHLSHVQRGFDASAVHAANGCPMIVLVGSVPTDVLCPDRLATINVNWWTGDQKPVT